MAQPIKHNTGTKTTGCCIRKNNFDIGVVPNHEYGPTSSTDFWVGYVIPNPGFVTYQDKGAQGPSIYSIPSINDLVAYGKNLNIGTVTGPAYVIRACSALSNLVMVNVDYVNLPQIDNNILTLDAGYTASYGWGGSEWYDISGGAVPQATTTGATVFTTGSTPYNYSNSYLNMPAASQNSMALLPTFGSALQTFTVNVWFKFNTSGGYASQQNVVGQQYSNATNYTPQTNCNFLIRGNGSNGFEGLIRLAGTNYTVNFGSVPPGNWVNLTLTYDGLELKSYVNGTPANSAAGPGVTLVSNGLQTIIGGTTNAVINTGVNNYLDAGMGVVNIYNSVLNDTEISTLYTAYSNQRGY
jgi:hypothetical protein